MNIKQTYDWMMESENAENVSCIDGHKNIIF